MARLDTKNGKAEFVPRLKVKRNTAYVLILKPNGQEIKRLEKPKTLESITETLSGLVGDGKDVAVEYPNVRELSDDASDKIAALAIEMLRTSNFNSVNHSEPFKGGVTQVHANYRKTLGGRYSIVTFDLPRKIKTIGGEVTATEIVIGLNRGDSADSLFTIDVQGRVVEHAEYSGTKSVALLDNVKAAVKEPK